MNHSFQHKYVIFETEILVSKSTTRNFVSSNIYLL